MKKILLILITFILSVTPVYALSSTFTIDSSKIVTTKTDKKADVIGNFNNSYSLSYSIKSENQGNNDKVIAEAKKVTALLLGNAGNNEETSEEYYSRAQEYYKEIYHKEVPKKANSDEEDTDSQEYKDDIVADISGYGMFDLINEMNIKYNSLGDIRVVNSNDMVNVMVVLPKVTLKKENSEDPLKYDTIQTNLLIYYCFKELDGEYKLYYLRATRTDNLEKYNVKVESNETANSMSIATSDNSDISKLYDMSKLNDVSKDTYNNIYNNNAANIVKLNAYYNNTVVSSANGFFINNGLVITAWSFMEKSLINAQYFAVTDNNNNPLEVEGIVTANPDTNIVVIKLKDKVSKKVNLGDYTKLKVEDPVISISSKTGVGLTAQGGIVISTDGYIQSLIQLVESDQGSPLFDTSGNVVGMNTSKLVNNSISMAVNSSALKEVQDKFNSIDYASIQTITFDKLKNDYYYVKQNDETIVNSIPSNVWSEYSSIGNIKDSIKLGIVKASYENGIVSLRYKNNASQFIDTMTLASSFEEELTKQSYKETLTSDKKRIYESDKYKVIIMNDFDYLIVVMVKK